MYMNMNTEKIVKIVLLVIIFCTLVGCSFCKTKENFSDLASSFIKEGDICGYEFGTEGCLGYNCVKDNGKQYKPDHGSCKTNYCACKDTESGNSVCKCDNIVDSLPDVITFTSNENDYEFYIYSYPGIKELNYINKNDSEISEYYKYDRQNNMFVPDEESNTFQTIKIINIDNMYDVKIEIDENVFSFKMIGDEKLTCFENEKLTHVYDNNGDYLDSFCFNNTPGPHKLRVSYNYEEINDDNVKCHNSCKSCGFSDDPSSDSDCITCKDGYKLHPVYRNGTGKCVNQDEQTEEPLIASDVTSTNESEDGPTMEKDDNFNVKLKNHFLYKLEFPEGMTVNSYEAESVEKDSVPKLIVRNENEYYEYKYNEKTKLYEDEENDFYLSFSKEEDNKLIIKDQDGKTGNAIEIESLSKQDNSKSDDSSCRWANDCQSRNCHKYECKKCSYDIPCGITLNSKMETEQVKCGKDGKCMWGLTKV